ncbi:DUF3883 domain-containing protein [Streptomyces sp. NPDC047022]|uniref:protein NO VEIN domain-containing protein n=1 Tax=Streptomyces sp. NPDC047022 TaxID=3155737 RepID=UPI0033CFCB80
MGSIYLAPEGRHAAGIAGGARADLARTASAPCSYTQGWTVKDVGDKESFDLLLTGEGKRLHVEVKGTTSVGLEVILTRAEVEKQRKHYPDNALVVVHSIELDRSGEEPATSGGVLHCTSPWVVEDEHLTVISYAYRTQVGMQSSGEVAGERTRFPPGVPQQRQAQEAPQVADGGRSPP